MHQIFDLEHDAPEYLIDEKYLEKVETIVGSGRGVPNDYGIEWAFDLDAFTTARSILKDPELRAAAIEAESSCNSCDWMAQVGLPRAPALCFATCSKIKLGLH